MVLANTLKTLLASLAGAVTIGFIAYWVIAIFANWYGPRFIKSDEDIGNIYVVALSIQALSVVAGAFIGAYLYRKAPKR